MRQFFWIIIFIYIFLYFYAVYLYEEFNLIMAAVIFAAIAAQFFFAKKRFNLNEEKRMSGEQQPAQAKVKPLGFWASPIPYGAIILLTYIGFLIMF